MRRLYIHERRDWPKFHWDEEEFAEVLASVRYRQGRRPGGHGKRRFHPPQEAVVQTLTADVVKSSEIEGEKLDTEQVRSSIARRLGMDIGGLMPPDRHVE